MEATPALICQSCVPTLSGAGNGVCRRERFQSDRCARRSWNESPLSLVHDVVRETPDPSFDMAALPRRARTNAIRCTAPHLNEQMVLCCRPSATTSGLVSGRGQYLWDRKGDRYLDLLSGWGVFALGRNHPDIRSRRSSACSTPTCPIWCRWTSRCFSGILAEKLLAHALARQGLSSGNSARRRSRPR